MSTCTCVFPEDPFYYVTLKECLKKKKVCFTHPTPLSFLLFNLLRPYLNINGLSFFDGFAFFFLFFQRSRLVYSDGMKLGLSQLLEISVLLQGSIRTTDRGFGCRYLYSLGFLRGIEDEDCLLNLFDDDSY